MESIRCNLCGGTRNRPFETVYDLLLERPDVRASLVECVECSLVYQNPRPTTAEIGVHYPAQYDSYVDHTHKKNSWLIQKAIDYGFWKRSRFVTRHKKEGTLLDIGCAAGSFLLGIQKHGNWRVRGVELSEEVALLARERYQLDVFAGELEDAAFPDQSFDVVTMWDVLEHLHDPDRGLHEIYRILKPGGLLVIRVPNLASWDAKLFGKYWAGFDAPRHLYVYTPQTLSKQLEQAGFSVEENSCGSASYMTFVLSVRFYLTAKKVSERTRDQVMWLLYHPIARLLSAPFFAIPNLGLNGPLLVTTAKKQGIG